MPEVRPAGWAHLLLDVSRGEAVSLQLVPVSFDEACGFVSLWHRHHAPPRGHKFSVGVANDNTLVGVAMVGRPTARHYDDGRTLEHRGVDGIARTLWEVAA